MYIGPLDCIQLSKLRMPAPAMSCTASSEASQPLISDDDRSQDPKSLHSQGDTTAGSLPQVEPPTVAAYGARLRDQNSATGFTFRFQPGEWFTDPEHTLRVTEMSRDSFQSWKPGSHMCRQMLRLSPALLESVRRFFFMRRRKICPCWISS
jgi:hypothetical protein